MIKKLLVGLAVLSCTISPQSSFAAENGTAAIYHLGSQAAGNETALSQSGNGLAPIGVKQADEESASIMRQATGGGMPGLF